MAAEILIATAIIAKTIDALQFGAVYLTGNKAVLSKEHANY